MSDDRKNLKDFDLNEKFVWFNGLIDYINSRNYV